VPPAFVVPGGPPRPPHPTPLRNPNSNTSPVPPVPGAAPANNNRPFRPPFPFPFPSLFTQGFGDQPAERKQWTVPDGRGATIRQRVENKERDVGLRCYDPSCGLAPTDDAPLVPTKNTKRVLIYKDNDADVHVCEHSFHSGCLVSAARVAGFHPQGEDQYEEVEVPCIVCRSHGHIGRNSWDDGVRQLEIET
jgi:hypothetical protein